MTDVRSRSFPVIEVNGLSASVCAEAFAPKRLRRSVRPKSWKLAERQTGAAGDDVSRRVR
jgi:hypothetical protein